MWINPVDQALNKLSQWHHHSGGGIITPVTEEGPRHKTCVTGIVPSVLYISSHLIFITALIFGYWQRLGEVSLPSYLSFSSLVFHLIITHTSSCYVLGTCAGPLEDTDPRMAFLLLFSLTNFYWPFKAQFKWSLLWEHHLLLKLQSHPHLLPLSHTSHLR